MLRPRERLPACVLFLSLGALLAGVGRLPQFATSESSSSAARRRPLELKIIAFNTHLLPEIALSRAGRRGQAKYRAAAIGRRLTKYDLIGLSEVFDDARRTELIDSLQQAADNEFQPVWYRKPRTRAFVNSGLLLLSRFPIESRHLLTYRHASRFLTYGFRADAFAAKGAIHARIRIDETTRIDCFLTHLESQSAAARAGQIKDLARFIAEHASPQRPAILMGDLNVAADFPADSPLKRGNDRRSSLYQQLLCAMQSSGIELVDVWPSLAAGAGGTSDAMAEDGGRRIDYVFVSAPRAGKVCSLRPVEIGVEKFLEPEVAEGSLSDHAAVWCELQVHAVGTNLRLVRDEQENASTDE